MTHREIADFVYEHYEVTGWWRSGHGRIRPDSRTAHDRAAPRRIVRGEQEPDCGGAGGAAYRAFTHAPTRRRWLPEAMKSPPRCATSRAHHLVGTTLRSGLLRSEGRAEDPVAIQHRNCRTPRRFAPGRVLAGTARRAGGALTS